MSNDKYGFRNFAFCDSHSVLVDRLSKAGGDLKLFDNMYELFTFAATVGFLKGRKVAPEKTGKTIEFNQFRSFDNFDGIFLCICLAHEKNANILNNNDEQIIARLKIFSEYANGGMEVIKDNIVDKHGELVDGFIHFIKDTGEGFKKKVDQASSVSRFKHLLEGLDS